VARPGGSPSSPSRPWWSSPPARFPWSPDGTPAGILSNGAVLNGDLNLSAPNAAVRLLSGADFTGTANLTGSSSALAYQDTRTLTGKTINMEGSSIRLAIDNGAYTADAGFFSQLACMHALGPYRLPNAFAEVMRCALDIADASDRLIDGLFAWGDANAIAARVKAHHDAGADHVCMQVVSANGLDGSLAAWREIAKVPR